MVHVGEGPATDLRLSDGTSIPGLFLILFGIFSVVSGGLLVALTATGASYDGVGATAMFLVVFAILIAFVGVTPVGTFRHSWPLFALGLALALFGGLVLLVPKALGGVADIVLGVLLVAMSIVRSIAYLRRRDAARLPASYTGTFVAMHALCLVLGVLLLSPAGVAPGVVRAVLMLLLGVSQVWLGLVTMRVERTLPGSVPSAVPPAQVEARPAMAIPVKFEILLFTAMLMLLMAVCAFLGVMRRIPYDDSRIISVFLFLTALQIILTGETPVRTFPLSRPLLALGMVLATLAMIAVVVPEAMHQAVSVVVGVCNLLVAVVGIRQFVRMAVALHREPPPAPARGTMRGLVVTGLCLQVLLLVFAANLLLPRAIPGLLMLAVVVVTSVLMIRLVILVGRTGWSRAG